MITDRWFPKERVQGLFRICDVGSNLTGSIYLFSHFHFLVLLLLHTTGPLTFSSLFLFFLKKRKEVVVEKALGA